MLLSKSCEYGIRATLHLARLGGNGYVSIREISDDMEISFHFLTKIFQKLTQAGILMSFRGPNGGVALARPAKDVQLLDIVVAIDGRSLFEECILGLPGCGNRTPCPLHASWAVERARLQKMFGSMTLEATAAELEELGLRLTATSTS